MSGTKMICALVDSARISDRHSAKMFEWFGGGCPVSAGTFVTVQFRNGDISAFEKAALWDWEHYVNHTEFDIVAYKIVD